MRRLVVLLTASALAAAAPSAGTAATVEVTMSAVDFLPRTVTLATRGDSVRWRNTDEQVHDVNSRLAGYFGTGLPGSLVPDETYTRTFPSAGTFGYVCQLHEPVGMTGRVRVPLRVRLVDDGRLFRIVVASATAATGWTHVIAVDPPGSTGWTTIRTTTAQSVLYDPGPHGTYAFRSFVKKVGTSQRSGASPVVTRTW